MTDPQAKIMGYLLGGSEAPSHTTPRRTFFSANGAPLPYSDRKALGGALAQWPLEDIVYAQQRACEGASNDEIAQEMGQSYHEVARVLNVEPKAERQPRAEVKRAEMKPRRRSFF